MMANFHGQAVNISDLRRALGVASKGMTLRELMAAAARLELAGRALRLSLDELPQLQLPCILHWDLNHFVVLSKVGRKTVTVLDPAVGERRLTHAELSNHFTGVALELTPTAEFKALAPAPRLSLAALTGKVTGLWRSLTQILCVAVVLELFAIVAPLMQQMVVDDVLTSGDRDMLTVLALGFGLLLVVQTLIGLARSWMVIILGQTLSLQWLSNVFAHLIRLPVGFLSGGIWVTSPRALVRCMTSSAR